MQILVTRVTKIVSLPKRRWRPSFVQVAPPAPPSPPRPTSPGRSGTLVPRDPKAPTKRIREHTEIVADLLNSLVGGGYIQMTGPREYVIMGGSFVESRAPTNADDSTAGINVGAHWINTATSPRTAYLCLDASPGAAVWKLL